MKVTLKHWCVILIGIMVLSWGCFFVLAGEFNQARSIIDNQKELIDLQQKVIDELSRFLPQLHGKAL